MFRHVNDIDDLPVITWGDPVDDGEDHCGDDVGDEDVFTASLAGVDGDATLERSGELVDVGSMGPSVNHVATGRLGEGAKVEHRLVIHVHGSRNRKEEAGVVDLGPVETSGSDTMVGVDDLVGKHCRNL